MSQSVFIWLLTLTYVVGFEDIANCNKYKYQRYLLYKMKCISLMIKGKCRRNKYNEIHNLHEHLQ